MCLRFSQHADVTPYSRALLFSEYLQIHSFVTDSYIYELFVNTHAQKNKHTRDRECICCQTEKTTGRRHTSSLLYIHIIYHTLYVEIGIDDDDEAKDEFKVYESGVVGSLARARFEWWREIRVRELRRTIDRVRTQNCLNFVSNRGAHQRCRWFGTSFCTSDSLSLSLTS